MSGILMCIIMPYIMLIDRRVRKCKRITSRLRASARFASSQAIDFRGRLRWEYGHRPLWREAGKVRGLNDKVRPPCVRIRKVADSDRGARPP